MKDTIIKGDGTSRTLKTPASMPKTFEEWRSQLLAGNATMDIGLNSDGCTVVGTAISKANLLSDTTKEDLELSQSDPTVNDALYALSQKSSLAASAAAAAQSTADAAMPKTGGKFQGDISGATVSAGSWSFKNISVHTSAGGDTGTNVQRIVMMRK